MSELQQLRCDRGLNEKTFLSIYWSVELSVLKKILHAKTAKESWNILLKIYKDADPIKWTRQQGPKGQFKLMEKGKYESIHDISPRWRNQSTK